MTKAETKFLATFARLVEKLETVVDALKPSDPWKRPKLSASDVIKLCPNASRGYYARMKAAGWIVADADGRYDTNEVREALEREDKLPALPTLKDAVWKCDLTTGTDHLIIGKRSACKSKNTGWGRAGNERQCTVCLGISRKHRS